MYTGRKLMIEILVAEDDEMIANLIKINLVKAGYLCTCAYNGKDAANLLDSKHFDLCLFDIMLPEIDGYELLVLLIRNKNIALYRDVIYENVWGNDYVGDSRTIDLHIQRLRRKLDWGDKIQSVYKVGYKLV